MWRDFALQPYRILNGVNHSAKKCQISRLLYTDGNLYSQTFTAFCTTSVQNGAAATGSHTGTEAMGALAAYNGRLVSTFHVGLANLAKNRFNFENWGCLNH